MSNTQPVVHSLAFRVMRLCRPTFHVETPLLFDPCDLVIGEDLFDSPSVAPHHLLRPGHDHSDESSSSSVGGSDLTYRNRFFLHDDSDAMGLPGLLVLPQSFGAIYLGETFCSYISINNSSNFEVRDIIIKSEIQTERQRILLLDTTKSPVESIRAGGRYDFIVEHDVKELGSHTLVCTALYYDGDADRKYLPQYFKFIVSNPLSVRTKVRVVKETTFLETCLENNTKSNLFMDQVEFEPAPRWSATMLKADVHHSEIGGFTREIFKPPVLVRSGGGIYNYLYALKMSPQPTKIEGNNFLGKLQITWRTNLGEPGRLQTQQIIGNPVLRKEVDLKAVQVPSVIIIEKPFPVQLSLTNLTGKKLGPFEVCLPLNDSKEEKAVMISGLQRMDLPVVEEFASLEFQLNLISAKLGVQKITGITVFDTVEKKTYDAMPDMEIFVDSDL
uniref:trafficking protein particle complex subunit 13-like n=1 Tax=Erigeron canadensis TaxID=72917 RepID=UPI001CB97128|nr:trafficking protein particle complex subunit 13-like [Erigeron canadensis]